MCSDRELKRVAERRSHLILATLIACAALKPVASSDHRDDMGAYFDSEGQLCPAEHNTPTRSS